MLPVKYRRELLRHFSEASMMWSSPKAPSAERFVVDLFDYAE